MDLATQKIFERMASEAKERAHNKKRQQHIEEFKTLDARELLEWDDSKLAAWQTQYESDEAQWIIADQEWKRRGGVSTRRIAMAALSVSIFSLAIASLTYWHLTDVQKSSPIKAPEQIVRLLIPPTQSPPTNQVLSSRKAVESTNLDSPPILQTQSH